MLEELKAEVCRANLELAKHGLITLTWGNVSGIDREQGLVVIKPSGVSYDDMRPEHMVVVDLDGAVVDGELRPSADTPSHVLLYKHFSDIGGVTHTHSRRASSFAQARVEIPCLGTTHADHFCGPVPVTRPFKEAEVGSDYEVNTAVMIIERFAEINPNEMPAVLVAGHAPFTWGPTPAKSVENAVALEAVADMALSTLAIRPDAPTLEPYVMNRNYLRKHGPDAYYGQRPGL